MVRPVLEYASPVWVGCCKQDALMLEKIQLRVARAAQHGCASLSDMNWPTLAWRRRLQCLLLFWKLLNHQGPPQLEDLLLSAASDHAPQYAFKKGQNLAFSRCTIRAHNKSFLPAAVALWNDLPALFSLVPLYILFVVPCLVTSVMIASFFGLA